MNLTLTRTDFENDGIYGVITDDKGMFLFHSLEHAYDSGLGNGTYTPKIPPGFYICKRSMHRLHHMTTDFETFEVINVPEHVNILFHWGNYNGDSDGCILLGRQMTLGPSGIKMITSSKDAFTQFMKLQTNTDAFNLVVE